MVMLHFECLFQEHSSFDFGNICGVYIQTHMLIGQMKPRPKDKIEISSHNSDHIALHNSEHNTLLSMINLADRDC